MGTIKRNFYNNITPTGKFDSADLTGTIPADNIANASLTNVTSVPASVGDFVQKVASDPTPASAGDVWYNTTSDLLKSVVSLEAWSSGSPLATARKQLASAGIQTSALAFGGENTSTAQISDTEEYNGSGYSTGGSLGTARNLLAGAGTQTAGLAFAGTTGSNSNVTEEYDGSSWTAGGNLSAARRYLAGAGTQTAGLAIAGFTTVAGVDSAEEYDGSAWTAGGSLNTARYALAGAGIQTAALGFGGSTPTATNVTEEYDGTSWSVGGNMNTTRRYLAGCGLQTSALAFGGWTPPRSTATESYDGSTWTTSPATLATAKSNQGGAGTQTAALAIGGNTDTEVVAVTEEYNKSTNVITAAAWSSGGNLNTARTSSGSGGPVTASWMAGGQEPSPSNKTEEYNGTSWTTSGTTTVPTYQGYGDGPQTSAFIAGGITEPGGPTGYGPLIITQEYNGSTWSPGGNLNITKYLHGGAGTQTTGLVFAGHQTPTIPAVQDTSEEYNGTSWTSGGTMNTARRNTGGVGTQTAALAVGGYITGSTSENITEEYNGTSWTSNPNLVQAGRSISSGGVASDAFANSGSGPVGGSDIQFTTTQVWNDTTWVTSASVATGRYEAARAGTSSSDRIFAGGNPGPAGVVTSTEEFNPETTAANVKTISTS